MFRDLFQTVALLPHETYLLDGQLLHKKDCLRCSLQKQIAELHEKVRLIVKAIDDAVGTYPSGGKIDRL